MPLQQCCDTCPSSELPAFFCFPSLRRPLGKVGAVWARMGKSSPTSIVTSSDCTFTPRRSRFHMHWRTHTRHMLDTCPTHARHMFGKPALCWRCMAVRRTATIATHCKDKGATRIKAQHGQSKPEDNYSCHNPKTMQYSCHNPKR